MAQHLDADLGGPDPAPATHEQQQHATLLWPALLHLPSPHTHFPDSFRHRFMQLADGEVKLLISQTCNAGLQWVLREATKVHLTVDLDVPASQLHQTLRNAQRTFRASPHVQWSLHLTQQQEDQPHALYMALLGLTQFSGSIIEVTLALPALGPDLLTAILTTFTQIQQFTMDTDLTDGLLPPLLQHAAHLKHLTVTRVRLEDPASGALVCQWDHITISDSDVDQYDTPTGVYAEWLTGLPLPADGALQVTLPEACRMLTCTLESYEGLDEAVAACLQCVKFTNLAEVQLVMDLESFGDEEAAAFLLAAQQMSCLQTQFAQAQPHPPQPHLPDQPCGVLTLRNLTFTTTLWRTLPQLSGWPQVSIPDAIESDTDCDVQFFDVPIANLTTLCLGWTDLDRQLLRNLLQHATGLRELVVRTVSLESDEFAGLRWGVTDLTVTQDGGEVEARVLDYLPMQPEGEDSALTVRLSGHEAKLVVNDVTEEGLPSAVRARLPTWHFPDVAHLRLCLAPTVPAAAQPQALTVALRQLQAAVVSKVQTLDLRGWSMSVGLAEAILGAQDCYKQFSMADLTWPEEVRITKRLPHIKELHLVSAVGGSVMQTLQRCVRSAGKVVFGAGLTVTEEYTGNGLAWVCAEVHGQTDIKSLARLCECMIVPIVKVDSCQIIFNLATQAEEEEVDSGLASASDHALTLKACDVVLRAPAGTTPQNEMEMLRYNTWALAVCVDAATVPADAVASVSLSGWRMRPAMVAELPDVRNKTCRLIFCDDITWPDSLQRSHLEQLPPHGVPASLIRAWHFPGRCHPEGVVWMCDVLERAIGPSGGPFHVAITVAPGLVSWLRRQLGPLRSAGGILVTEAQPTAAPQASAVMRS